MTAIWNFFRGLKNLWDYAPVIWHDRDWDWTFLARLMEFKILKMAEAAKGWNNVGAESQPGANASVRRIA